MNELAPLDPVYVQDVLSKPPFVDLPGVFNVRDLGNLPSAIYDGYVTKPQFLFRSAELSSITEEGKAKMAELGITKVFDFRSDTEIRKYNSPIPVIDGVEITHVPVFKTADYSPEMMARRYELYASGKTEAFIELYSQILDHGGHAFGSLLRHVRDRPNEACLFYCTAGKDRTGLMAAIILKLAGVSHKDISKDYAFTRVGREPARKKILQRLSKEPIFASDNDAALNMFTCRHETMQAFLEHLDSEYGGVEEYVRRYVGLSDKDIATIKRNILVPTKSI